MYQHGKTSMQPDVIYPARATLGEGAFWEARQQLLYWVDIQQKQLHAFSPGQKTNRTLQLEKFIGTVVARSRGGTAIALQDGIYLLDTLDARPQLLAPIEAQRPDTRFNDGKADPAGRFVAGTMACKADGSSSGIRNQGSLYSISALGIPTTLLQNVSTPNGLAWNAAGTIMYHIDTPTRAISVYQYNPDTGEILKKVRQIPVAAELGKPDGMTIDAEGCLWVAMWGGAQVVRINPQNNTVFCRIKLPTDLVTSCAFGGKNLDELYITTASAALTPQQRAAQPHAGDLFVAAVGISGVELPCFAG
jgi:sugar lactone lactonase YvrE